MKNILSILILGLTTSICANAQVLGTGAVDTVNRTKNVMVTEPKAELSNISQNPDNAASKNPTEKKVEEQPQVAPTGKPKLED